MTIKGAAGVATSFSGVIADGGGGCVDCPHGKLAIVKAGPSTQIFAGANTYTGGTTISGGVLQLGNGGTTGSIVGNVTDNGILAFDHSNTATFAGAISGSGAVQQIGSGITEMTGNDIYTGGTTIRAGVLQIGAGGANAISGSIVGNVVDNGVLAFGRSDATTFGGVISGSGAVMEQGIGVTTLSGANTYAGGTSLSAGALAIGNDSALGTGPLAMAAGTTLSFLSSGNFTIGNSITISGDPSFTPPSGTTQTLSGVISDGSSPGTLAMNGAGTLVLSATNAYTGPTDVNSGTLDVAGSIASSSLTMVASGATLTGSGAVGSLQIASGGVFAPGSGAAGSSMSVYGALVFNSSTTYQVQVSPNAASFAKVSGAASLAGAVSADFASGSYLTKQYTILTASGGLGGTTFANLANINLPGGFTDSLSYDSDNVYLNLKANIGAVSAFGLNVNQTNVANALNGAFNRGASLPPAFVNVFGLTGANLANALTQLSGEAAVGAEQGAFQFTNSFLSLMLDPFTENRGGFGGAGFGSALGYADDAQTPSAISSAFSALATPGITGLGYQPAWTVWGAAFGGGEQVSGNAAIGSHDTTSGTGGGVVGADYHVSPDAMLGFAIAYGGMNWSTSGLGGGRSDVFQAGLYAADEFGPAYVAGALALGDYWVTTNRSASLPGGDVFNANFNAQGFGGRIESGYRIALAPLTLTPYAAFQAQNFRTPSYSESAASEATAFALSYASQSAADTRIELGAWADKTFAYPDGDALKLFGRAAWVHQWETNPALQATFVGLPTASFTVNGARQAPDQALVAAGAEWRFAKNWTALVKFEGEFGNGTQIYAATGRISYSW